MFLFFAARELNDVNIFFLPPWLFLPPHARKKGQKRSWSFTRETTDKFDSEVFAQCACFAKSCLRYLGSMVSFLAHDCFIINQKKEPDFHASHPRVARKFTSANFAVDDSKCRLSVETAFERCYRLSLVGSAFATSFRNAIRNGPRLYNVADIGSWVHVAPSNCTVESCVALYFRFLFLFVASALRLPASPVLNLSIV